jgi:hypothetical protein
MSESTTDEVIVRNSAPKWAEAAYRRDCLMLLAAASCPGWLDEQFTPRVDVRSECHVWTAPSGKSRYGNISIPKRVATNRAGNTIVVLTHRLAFVLAAGEPVPRGMTLDHLCKNTFCCNPQHLDPVNQGTNTGRGHGKRSASIASRAATGLCTRGHDDWVQSRDSKKSGFMCAQCQRDGSLDRYRVVSAAFKALGMTQREYLAKYGGSKQVAEELLRRQGVGGER